jgi:sarcosine oxidase subunit gamma
MPDSAPEIIEQAAPRTIAAIGAFSDRAPLLAALHAEYGVAPPITPAFVRAGPVTLSCLSPSRYLATATQDATLPQRLAHTLAGLAAVTDQSDLWETFAFSGRQIRDRLARLVPIDIAPEIFRIGDLALTRAGHIDVRLWRIGGDSYELAVARSYGADFRYTVAKEGSVLF